MFDALKGLGNPLALMGKVREMQDKMKQMQEELARKQVTADAGGGMVEATVNGRMELIKLHIDKSRVDLNDTDMLEDRFWVDVQDFFGQRVIVPTSNNADFVVNALDNLTGSNALIGLRSRSDGARPFTVVQQMQQMMWRVV